MPMAAALWGLLGPMTVVRQGGAPLRLVRPEDALAAGDVQLVYSATGDWEGRMQARRWSEGGPRHEKI